MGFIGLAQGPALNVYCRSALIPGGTFPLLLLARAGPKYLKAASKKSFFGRFAYIFIVNFFLNAHLTLEPMSCKKEEKVICHYTKGIIRNHVAINSIKFSVESHCLVGVTSRPALLLVRNCHTHK